MREEAVQIISAAHFGWFAYSREEGRREFLAPVACWALVESSGNVRRVVGLTAHGLGAVTRVEELPGFVEYRPYRKRGAREDPSPMLYPCLMKKTPRKSWFEHKKHSSHKKRGA